MRFMSNVRWTLLVIIRTRLNTNPTKCTIGSSMQGCLRWGNSCPSALFHGGTEDVRISLHAELFLPLLSCEGAFSGVVDSLVLEHFSGGKLPDPELLMVYLWDQYTKHSSSGKELEDQRLENMHKYRCALRGRLVPSHSYAQVSLVAWGYWMEAINCESFHAGCMNKRQFALKVSPSSLK